MAASLSTDTSLATISPRTSTVTLAATPPATAVKTRPSFSASGSSGRTSSATTPPACTLTASGTNSPCSASLTLRATARPALSCASCGGRAQVRGGHHVVEREQRRGGARLLGVHVDAGAGDPALGDRVGERLLVDQPAAGGVDDAHARLDQLPAPSRRSGPTVSGVFGRWIEMKSLSRSSSSSPTRRTPSCAARAGWTYGSYAISRVPNAAIRCANSTPMRPRPTTPTVLPCDLDAGVLGPLPLARLERGAGAGGVAGDGEQQRDGLLGGRDDVGGRRVDDHDAAGGGGGHLDVVQTDAGAGDDLEPRRGGDRLGVDLGGAADDHRVGVGERGEQRRPVGAVDVADVEVVRRARRWRRGRVPRRSVRRESSVLLIGREAAPRQVRVHPRS